MPDVASTPGPGVIAVVGVGQGLGAAIARRFAHEGYAVGLMARSEDTVNRVREDIASIGGQALAIPMDATDEASVARAFTRVEQELGAPAVLAYNAVARISGTALDLDPDEFAESLRISCHAAFLASRAVLPAMLARGHGTVLLTGGGICRRYLPSMQALAVGKHALRGLALGLAGDFESRGIHVAHVVLDGPVNTERTRAVFPNVPPERMLDPAAVADTYWTLHRQPRSAWTAELDLRPPV